MEEKLHQIIYISTAETTLTESALLELLSESQKRNEARGITGLLLHSDNNIIQIIEGPEDATKALYKKISKDPRHRGVTLMSSKAIEHRDFPQYKMGFKRTSNKELTEHLPCFSQIVDNGALPPEELEGVSKLVTVMLRTFARTTNIERFRYDKVS
ncbi:BLUF domain-containing protein [Coraliomargarita algicola]|uniref:BLUF domain-containing protein n=1 Tax=Coraliomargarita algicola TaxID=3092156 RepID=A0ABZ0RGX8_9BACT|nr:BLUF domain-containing protein [Coraliomargarita sp. J2-16]WPJ94773.1 BLUF domain-containing protein [Coraliomargarita sp. J2-16]